MHLTEQPPPGGVGSSDGRAAPAPVVSLDAAATTHCRRRIHLDHDPAAVGAPRALPDPALAQRRADAAEYRARTGALLAAAAGPGWHAVPPDATDRAGATAAAVAAGARYVWGAVLPAEPGRRGHAELWG